MPVKAKDPCKDALTPATANGCARKWSRKRAAATIGPMVWDDDGPMPTLNISKTDKNMRSALVAVVFSYLEDMWRRDQKRQIDCLLRDWAVNY